jgi:hypothetical protein
MCRAVVELVALSGEAQASGQAWRCLGQHGCTTMCTGCRAGLLCLVCSTDSCAESCFVWVVSPRVPHRLARAAAAAEKQSHKSSTCKGLWQVAVRATVVQPTKTRVTIYSRSGAQHTVTSHEEHHCQRRPCVVSGTTVKAATAAAAAGVTTITALHRLTTTLSSQHFLVGGFQT